MPSKTKSADHDTSDEAIKVRAYHLWEADGRPEGKHDHYWFIASEEAKKAAPKANGSKPAASAKATKPAKAAKPAKEAPKPAAKPVKAKAAPAEAPKAAKKAATKPRAAAVSAKK